MVFPLLWVSILVKIPLLDGNLPLVPSLLWLLSEIGRMYLRTKQKNTFRRLSSSYAVLVERNTEKSDKAARKSAFDLLTSLQLLLKLAIVCDQINQSYWVVSIDRIRCWVNIIEVSLFEHCWWLLVEICHVVRVLFSPLLSCVMSSLVREVALGKSTSN